MNVRIEIHGQFFIVSKILDLWVQLFLSFQKPFANFFYCVSGHENHSAEVPAQHFQCNTNNATIPPQHSQCNILRLTPLLKHS